VEFLPHGKSGKTGSRGIRGGARGDVRRGGRQRWGRVAVLASAATMVSMVLPAGIGDAASTGTPGSLQATVAEANKLSNEIDALGQQYDALRIQLTEARQETQVANETALRDQRALGTGQAAVGEIAAEGFMQGGLSPTIAMLQSSDPQEFLDRASIMLQLTHEQNGTMSLLTEAEGAANRAKATAVQAAAQAATLSAAMSKKVGQIQAKENVLNSSAFSQALAIFQKTGSYPAVQVSGDSLGEQALRWALKERGVEYTWGGASPQTGFDCSGLVMWAYEQVGVQLEHFTGDQWDEGEHIPQSQIEPGDLLFFFNLDHVGLYLGGNLFLDAPTQGQVVQIQTIPWGSFDGAVRIIA
jgi:cell wall-associated NlpC family hydrolase